MSEQTEELEGQRSQKGSLFATLRSFTEHPGWVVYSRMLGEQQEARKGEILLKPLTKDDSVFAQEFMKGEVSGLSLAQVAPFAQMEVLQAELRVLNAQLEREDELAKARTDAAGKSRVDDEQFSGE